MINQSLTQDLLSTLFNYNGKNLIWKVNRGNLALKGKVAGCIDKQGYRVIRLNRKLHKEHRLIWLLVYGQFPKHEIDHINGIRSDNTLSNLRDVKHKVNSKNQKMYIHNTSGFRGTSKQGKYWVAYITNNNQQIYLGNFSTQEQAISMRLTAEDYFDYHKNHGRKK